MLKNEVFDTSMVGDEVYDNVYVSTNEVENGFMYDGQVIDLDNLEKYDPYFLEDMRSYSGLSDEYFKFLDKQYGRDTLIKLDMSSRYGKYAGK